MSQTGTELIIRSLEQKKSLWEKEQLQKFAESGKEPKNDSWKNKYKGVAEIEGKTHELPSDWGWASAEAICSSVRDGTHDTPKYVEKGIPLITSKNLVEGKLDLSKMQMISEKDHEEISKRSGVDDGDILYAMIGTIGNPVVVKKLTEFSIKNVGLFKKNEEFIFSNYLKYWLDAPQFNNWLKPRLKGTTQKFAPLGLLRALPVPVAPHEQQKRIVAKIEELFSHIDAGIKALKKAKQLLKQYRQSVLKAAVTGELTKEWREANKNKLEPASQLLQRILKERRQKWEEQQLEKFKAKGKMPKNDKWKEKYKEPYRIDPAELEIADGWVLASWDQISNWVTYGFTRPMPHVEEGIPIVTGKNVIESKIKLENAHKTPKDNYESLSEKDRPKAGDLLITKDGTIGRAAVVPEGLEFCINQSVAVIWLRSCPISRKYLLALIESDLIQKPIMAKARGVAIQHLSITDFAKLPVPIPSLKEQDEIIVELNEKLELIARTEITIEQQLAKAEKNKQSILASAYSGRLADEND